MIEFGIPKKVTQGLKQYESGIINLKDKLVMKSIVQAGNSAGGSAATRVRQILRKELDVSSASNAPKIRERIKKDVVLIKAFMGTVGVEEKQIVVKVKGGRMRLIWWSKGEALTTRKGKVISSAGVKVKVWGKTQTLPGTFIAPVKYGKNLEGKTEGIFKRLNDNRLPIQQLYGPGMAREAERHEDEIILRFSEQMEKVLPGKLEHNIRKAMEGKR